MSQIAELVAELKVDRDKLERAIDVLSNLYGKPETVATVAGRKQMSSAAKARIAAAQRKRWAKYRKEKKSA